MWWGGRRVLIVRQRVRPKSMVWVTGRRSEDGCKASSPDLPTWSSLHRVCSGQLDTKQSLEVQSRPAAVAPAALP